MEYIQSDRTSECVLCEKCASHEDAPNLVLYRGRKAYVILNRYPYNNGHLMVVPYEHVANLEDVDTETLTELMLLVNRALAALRETMAPDGFNVGINLGRAAGAGLDQHVHIHVVPRWRGDTNFMPVLDETRVIPQMLQETYALLMPAIRKG
jgi:ATP adenylyltransferase